MSTQHSTLSSTKCAHGARYLPAPFKATKQQHTTLTPQATSHNSPTAWDKRLLAFY